MYLSLCPFHLESLEKHQCPGCTPRQLELLRWKLGKVVF